MVEDDGGDLVNVDTVVVYVDKVVVMETTPKSIVEAFSYPSTHWVLCDSRCDRQFVIVYHRPCLWMCVFKFPFPPPAHEGVRTRASDGCRFDSIHSGTGLAYVSIDTRPVLPWVGPFA